MLKENIIIVLFLKSKFKQGLKSYLTLTLSAPGLVIIVFVLLLLPELGAGEHPGVALKTEAQGGHTRLTPLLSAGDSLDLRADDAILYHLDNTR